MAQTVKRLPTMRETQVQSLGREDLLEKAGATHSSTLAWKIPRMKEPRSLSPWGHKESDTTERLHYKGLPGGASGKEPASQCRRGKDTWV